MTAAAALSLPHTTPDNLETLLDIIERLSLARSVQDIAAVVRTGARRLTGADGIAVVVRDEDRCHYIDEDSIAPLWKGLKFPMTACISGWAMLNRKTAVIPDIYVDARIPHDAYRPTFVKSLVMTPVRPSDPVAAIGAYWAEERTPTEDEVQALVAVARATATAFENVRLIGSLEEAVERREFLIRELDHRVKNTLSGVQAIFRQSLRGGPEAVEASFNARLSALSRTHELLTLRAWKAAPLEELARRALAPFDPGEQVRINIDGPPLTLTPEAAVTVAMALHELAMNAARYGALSNPAGHVRLNWSTPVVGEDRHFELEWREADGPAVAAPVHHGMGFDLVTRALPRVMAGEASLDFPATGVRYRLIAPLSDRIALT